MATVFTLRGLGDPVDVVSEFFGGSIAAGNTVVRIFYPQAGLEIMAGIVEVFFPFPPEAVATLVLAAAELDAALTLTPGEKIVMGHSMGAVVAAYWLLSHGPTSEVDPDEVSFILIGNPVHKYGGVFYQPGYCVPEDTPYTVLDVWNQYDGFADWPGTLPTTSPSIAVLDALWGALSVHINYWESNLADPDRRESVEGNITYRMLPTYPVPILLKTALPLLGMLYANPIIEQADKAIRPLIEASYTRPPALAPTTPPYEPPAPEPTSPPSSPGVTPPAPPAPLAIPGHCADPNHFYLVDGALRPQPWMKFRPVGSVEALSKTSSYKASGGGNKDELVHSLQLNWTNLSPLPQWVYGMISRGGVQVTLQARSRGYLKLSSGYGVGVDAGDLVECSRVGVGADMGRAGLLSIGTGYCVLDARQNSRTIPLAPERTGWQRLEPGETLTGRVELRFVSDYWETGTIDGGDLGTESKFVCGDTRLDLFALPIIEPGTYISSRGS